MVESLNSNNNGGQIQRRLNGRVDRLSALPDTILIDILSLLPIENAAATSVLSHRWRYLWTGVTRLEISFDDHSSPQFRYFIVVVNTILCQLTSRKLHIVDAMVPSHTDNSFLREMCRRNVEEISISIDTSQELPNGFKVPAFLLSHQPLVCLELYGILNFELPENGVTQLPNLKKLILNHFTEVPPWLGTLFRYCPLLEYLDLMFDIVSPQPLSFLNIHGLNLKTLRINMEVEQKKTLCTKISIDAPNLENLEIQDCTSFYYFVNVPTTLVRAIVDWSEDDFGYDAVLAGAKDFLCQMSKFIRGMSSVSSFELELKYYINIITYSISVNDKVSSIFHNLSLLKISLDDIGSNGWKDLLLSLHSFPRLKHLEVKLYYDLSMENMSWCAPESLPDCVVQKINTIQIWGINGTDYELKLLGYILRNAAVLNKFHVNINIVNKSEESRLWEERLFCIKLFNLPNSSLACEVVFSGQYIKASSIAFRKGNFICNMSVG